MDSSFTLLKQEINKTQEFQHDLAKWKLAVSAAMGAAAFGLSKDNHPNYWLLFLVPFVCAYIDLYDYQFRLRVLVIAKFLRDHSDDPVLQKYEKTCEAARNDRIFDLGNIAGLSSSIGASVVGPVFYFLSTPLGPAIDSLLVSERAAVVLWSLGVICVIGLYWNYWRKEKKLCDKIPCEKPNKKQVVSGQ